MGNTCSNRTHTSRDAVRTHCPEIRPNIHHELLSRRRITKFTKKMLYERDTFGYTALHICALYDNSIEAGKFVKYMEDIDLKAYTTERTPLHIAAWNQSQKVVEKIVQSNKMDINVTDKEGSTPFHLVFTTRRSYSAIKNISYQLITNGGNFFQKNLKEYTPMDYCRNNSYYKLCGRDLENYTNGNTFLFAKNILSLYLELYDNAMEMILLYNVLPFLVDDKSMNAFIAKLPTLTKVTIDDPEDDYKGKHNNTVTMLDKRLKESLDKYLFKQLNL